MPVFDSEHLPQAFFPSYDVLCPTTQSQPFVFSSPHSGRVYPREFLNQTRLDPATLRRSEDSFVDKLFEGVATLGAPLISVRFPRAYLDLNREPYELDSELIGEPLPGYANTQSIRVAGGLGTVARIVADGEPIYAGRLKLAHVMARIEQLYFPFHSELNRLIDETQRIFGYAVLIDCHSMPSSAMTPGGGARPDVVIGDRYGSSANPAISSIVRQAFVKRGYKVQMNRPYAGGYITEHHGLPARGVHALQLELNRSLYMDERAFEPHRGYATLVANLNAIVSDLMRDVPELFDLKAAAE